MALWYNDYELLTSLKASSWFWPLKEIFGFNDLPLTLWSFAQVYMKIIHVFHFMFHIPHDRFIPRTVPEYVVFLILCVSLWWSMWQKKPRSEQITLYGSVGHRPASILSSASRLSPLLPFSLFAHYIIWPLHSASELCKLSEVTTTSVSENGDLKRLQLCK